VARRRQARRRNRVHLLRPVVVAVEPAAGDRMMTKTRVSLVSLSVLTLVSALLTGCPDKEADKAKADPSAKAPAAASPSSASSKDDKGGW
jgi:hypothetical protein